MVLGGRFLFLVLSSDFNVEAALRVKASMCFGKWLSGEAANPTKSLLRIKKFPIEFDSLEEIPPCMLMLFDFWFVLLHMTN